MLPVLPVEDNMAFKIVLYQNNSDYVLGTQGKEEKTLMKVFVEAWNFRNTL